MHVDVCAAGVQVGGVHPHHVVRGGLRPGEGREVAVGPVVGLGLVRAADIQQGVGEVTGGGSNVGEGRECVHLVTVVLVVAPHVRHELLPQQPVPRPHRHVHPALKIVVVRGGHQILTPHVQVQRRRDHRHQHQQGDGRAEQLAAEHLLVPRPVPDPALDQGPELLQLQGAAGLGVLVLLRRGLARLLLLCVGGGLALPRRVPGGDLEEHLFQLCHTQPVVLDPQPLPLLVLVQHPQQPGEHRRSIEGHLEPQLRAHPGQAHAGHARDGLDLLGHQVLDGLLRGVRLLLLEGHDVPAAVLLLEEHAGAVALDLPAGHNTDPVPENLRLVHVVRGQAQNPPLPATPQQVPHRPPGVGVHAGRRLIQDHELGVAQEGHGY
mmetsp:Transcript_5133/g.12050  ORF Transcript_5133/g.12050 Transcript_5133/m.12050 type:complete len:378 (+) Transcript_5133:2213-3346(+)